MTRHIIGISIPMTNENAKAAVKWVKMKGFRYTHRMLTQWGQFFFTSECFDFFYGDSDRPIYDMYIENIPGLGVVKTVFQHD